MSSYHPPKGLVNRYWKRPKPRIYECNIRDAERFYKDSYNQYLQSKHFSASHGTKPTDIEEQFATRWTLNRMNSKLDSQFEPFVRESSLSGFNNDYRPDIDETGPRSSRVTFSRHDSQNENFNDSRSGLRARSLVQPAREPSSDSQQENIENRLERIKRLREELGLKIEGTMEDLNINNTSSRPILKKSAQQDSSNETRSYQCEMSQNVHSNGAKTNNRTGGSIAEQNTDKYESRYGARRDWSTGNDRNGDIHNNVSFNNVSERTSKSYMPSDTEQYSTRSKGRDNKYSSGETYSSSYRNNGNKYKDDDFSKEAQYAPSYRNKGRKYDDNDRSYESTSVRTAKKNSTSAGAEPVDHYNIGNDDDDELVSNLKKRFPTSDEILQRIKKIDDNL